jgi:hypothetical protein
VNVERDGTRFELSVDRSLSAQEMKRRVEAEIGTSSLRPIVDDISVTGNVRVGDLPPGRILELGCHCIE